MTTIAPEHLHEVRFPSESDEYRHARDELLRAEIELRAHTEAVAEQRRRLPLGGAVEDDYEFQEWDSRTGAPQAVRLSELFYAPAAPGQHARHVDFMWPVWNILDTTPTGRTDFSLSLQYD